METDSRVEVLNRLSVRKGKKKKITSDEVFVGKTGKRETLVTSENIEAWGQRKSRTRWID